MTRRIEAGQIFVLYSDGITEASDSHEEEFGEQRLETIIRESATLSANKIVDNIITSVETYAAGMEQSDDITLIVIKT